MSKFIRQFEFSENLEDLDGKLCWRSIARPLLSNDFFHTNLLTHLKIQPVINDGALGHCDIFDMLFPFLAFAKL